MSAETAKRLRAVKANPLGSNQYRKVDLEATLSSKSSNGEPTERTRAADACRDVLVLYTVAELTTEVREGVRLGGGGVWHQVAAQVLRERLARRSGPTLAEQMAAKSFEHLRALVNLGRQLEHEERDLYRAARAELARRQGVRP